MTGRKKLAGDLANLPFGQLLRLIEAASATGILTVEGGEERVRLAIAEGRMVRPDVLTLRSMSRLLPAASGRFRFESDPSIRLEGITVPLSVVEELAENAGERAALSSDLGVDELIEASLIAEEPSPSLPIHHLPPIASEDPLEALVEELRDAAPEDLDLAQIGVVAGDPRVWRGSVEGRWRERGWELRLLSGPGAALEGVDLVVIHHQLSITRVGSEEDWLALVSRARSPEAGIPVIWVGPLADSRWVARLVQAGVDFLLPPPAGDIGEPLERFHETLATVVDRLLERRRYEGRGLGEPLAELAEALFAGGSPENAVAAVLQMASRVLRRAAIVRVEPTVFRCWAGFGYPLEEGSRILPRGIAVLERAARGQGPVTSIEAPGQGRRQLARLMGVETLPDGTCIIPLEARGRTVGLLVGDREGEPLDRLAEIIGLAPRLGLLLEGTTDQVE